MLLLFPGSRADFQSMTKMFNFDFFNYVAGNYFGVSENRPSSVHAKKLLAEFLGIKPLVFLFLSLSFTVFSVARPTFLCLQVTL